MQLAVRDAAKLLSVSEKTIYRWIAQGSLPAYKVAEQYRFNRAELLEWATSRKINVSPDIFEEPDDKSSGGADLCDALQAGGVFYRIEGGTKEEVLKNVVDNMRLPDEVNREFLLQVMLARERIASTGIGEGIAIPHVRNPIVLHVTRPSVTLCFLEKPVDFGALDGKPVTALFAMVSPTVRAHLYLLSRLSFLLRGKNFKEIIVKQGTREQVFNEIRRIESALSNAGGAEKPQS